MAADAVRPVPVPPVESLKGVPVPFEACMRCGYLAVRAAEIRDGGAAVQSALAADRVCPRCAHRGPPITFERHVDYVDFVRELATPSPARG